ncbi:hypothetical protein LTR37_015184 [Vermiconidia calcicola]|uniref:Uncharacterized protein n=1 Tax=Vermiconidia calcicola TaxID=1690605 RepID=A0ACC3MR91_9PEZI|nr:hypothetical protein LTR37_015184 [Vermiconidia calcicola]
MTVSGETMLTRDSSRLLCNTDWDHDGFCKEAHNDDKNGEVVKEAPLAPSAPSTSPIVVEKRFLVPNQPMLSSILPNTETFTPAPSSSPATENFKRDEDCECPHPWWSTDCEKCNGCVRGIEWSKGTCLLGRVSEEKMQELWEDPDYCKHHYFSFACFWTGVFKPRRRILSKAPVQVGIE